MRFTVTGAAGFVGREVVRALAARGDTVLGAVGPGEDPPLLADLGPGEVRWARLDLRDINSVAAVAMEPADGVIHLAAVASSMAARRDPGLAWEVNAAGTARLAAALAAVGRDPLLLVVSTGEVYGSGSGRPARESDAVEPRGPYAASKLGGEVAALAEARSSGLRVVVARAFPHTGAGQRPTYALPAFAARIREAARRGAATAQTGNVDLVRDYLHVRDVVAAYLLLLERGTPGEVYNVARGEGKPLRAIFAALAAQAGAAVTPAPDPALMRSADLAYLVGDPTKLHAATGWSPAISLEATLQDLLHAEAD